VRLSMRTKDKIKGILVYTTIIVIIFVHLIPIYWTASTAFKYLEDVYNMPPEWIPKRPTLDAYVRVFVSRPLFHWVWNTMVLSGAVTFLTVVVSALAAYSISRFRFPGSQYASLMIIATRFIPPMATTVPIFLMYQALGIYNTMIGLVLILTFLQLPFRIWLLNAFFESIPWDLEEMGMIDGCTRVGAFFRIIIPISLPAFSAVGILTFIGTWNSFYWPLVLTQGAENKVLSLGIYDFIGDTMIFTNELCAGGIIMSIPSFLFVIFASKYMIRGLTAGALKGL